MVDSPVHRSLSLVIGVRVRYWGRGVEIEGLDDPESRLQTRLFFGDCREIRWSAFDEEATESEADVIGLCLGLNDYVEPAVITTDLFELSISYRSCDIESASSSFNVVEWQESVAER
jgi:hypothetical protein